ncbi:hypothetical protein Ancab_023589 [Ancistrocladus abbreviatus]
MRFAFFVNVLACAQCLCQRTASNALRSNMFVSCNELMRWLNFGHVSYSSIELKTDEDVVRFSIGNGSRDKRKEGSSSNKGNKVMKRKKMSRKAKLNELRFYRLKAKKKMQSQNPEVSIRYKLEKAALKEDGFAVLVASPVTPSRFEAMEILERKKRERKQFTEWKEKERRKEKDIYEELFCSGTMSNFLKCRTKDFSFTYSTSIYNECLYIHPKNKLYNCLTTLQNNTSG